MYVCMCFILIHRIESNNRSQRDQVYIYTYLIDSLFVVFFFQLEVLHLLRYYIVYIFL